jgi:carbonic anhydrase/acetyltransferase-like protein (isoleucine patch superfamily)
MRRLETVRRGPDLMYRWPRHLGFWRPFRNAAVLTLCRYVPWPAVKNALLRRIGVRVGPGAAIGLMAMLDIFFPELVEIGDGAIVGYNATILTHEFVPGELRRGPVRIGKGALVGAGAVVLAGVEIGDGAVVGAGAVVASDVPPGVRVFGVPARSPTHVVAYEGARPDVSPEAFVAPNATLVGRVRVEREASIWFGAVLRADGDAIEIGEGSNVQDNAVVHADPGFPVLVGRRVTVGHAAILHGCTVEDGALVGMGAIAMNGAVVGAGALLAAGALLPEGKAVPPGWLAMGQPARPVRPLGAEERSKLERSAEYYIRRSHAYARSRPNPEGQR